MGSPVPVRCAVAVAATLLGAPAPAGGPGVLSLPHAVQPDDGTAPGPSRNGRIVAFEASWRDAGGGRFDPAGTPTVFAWDRRLGTVAAITAAGPSTEPSAANATFRLPLGPSLVDETRARTVVAFRSSANPTGANADGSPEIFAWDSVTGAITQLSNALVGESSRPAVGARFVPQENAAGRPTGTILLRYRVAFLSTSDLDGDNPDGLPQVFLYDSGADAVGRMRQVSFSAGGAAGAPAVDAAGTRIAFVHAADLLPGDGPPLPAVYVYDVHRGLRRVSGGEGTEPADPVLDARGRHVAWSAVPAGGGPRAVFLANLRSGSVERVSPEGVEAGHPSLGRGARRIALLLGTEGARRVALLERGRGERPLAGAAAATDPGPPTLVATTPPRVLVTSTGDPDGTNPAGRTKVYLLGPDR